MDDLLIKYLLGEATTEEVAQVKRWLEADAANRQRYEQFRAVWAISRRTAEQASARSGSGSGFGSRFGAGSGFGSGSGKEKTGNVKRIGRLRLAAVMIGILLLAAGGYFLLMTHRPVAASTSVAGTMRPGGLRTTEIPPTVNSSPVPEEGKVPDRDKKFWRGEKLLAASRPGTDTLPDGTVVTLNRGASLTFAGGSVARGLTVRLQGEGFFSVSHDPARAFVVQVGRVAIKVLGTSFEVNGNGNDSIELIVETGAVRAADRGAGDRLGDSVIVHAGERLSMTGSKIWKIIPNRDNLYGYYLGRPLVCDSVPLRRLVEVLNRADDATIVLGRKELGDLPLTTIFRGETPERILDIVALTFDLSVVRQGSEIILQ
jgi:ferric-dicitrate binding protein FerR (iron transport regulator)